MNTHPSSEHLLPLVYDELRRIAARLMRQGLVNQTLQPTAIVHEAWMKMAAGGTAVWQSRGHFQAVAARAMRQVLIDHARRRKAAKRGGGVRGITWEDDLVVDESSPESAVDVLDLETALVELERLNPRHAKLVELRFFGGLTAADAADALGISLSSAEKDWRLARSWLLSTLSARGG